MRKCFGWCFLLLFSWQLVGYVVFFEWKHTRIKKEIKSLLKRGVPPEELVDFHFNTSQIERLKWLKKNEFEWNNQLFDVVQSFTGCDGITHFRCISDTQEKVLFKDLNKHIASNLQDDSQNSTVLKLVKVLLIDRFEFPDPTIEVYLPERRQDCFVYLSKLSSPFIPIHTPPPNLNCLSYRC
jgi:hypothetical protein